MINPIKTLQKIQHRASKFECISYHINDLGHVCGSPWRGLVDLTPVLS